MDISAHSHDVPAVQAPAQGGRWLEEDLFDRFMPGLLVAAYFLAAAMAISAGLY